jgi:hypothetical protein
MVYLGDMVPLIRTYVNFCGDHKEGAMAKTLVALLAVLLLGVASVGVVAGAPNCWTNGEAIIAPSQAGIEQMLRIMRSGDRAAWQALWDQRLISRLPHGLPVYVDDGVWHPRALSSGPVPIRLEGQLDRIWTDWQWLACEPPAPATPEPGPAQRPRRK